MKTPSLRTFVGTVTACFVLTVSLSATEELPLGQWKVSFDNGVVEMCEIRADGSVSVDQAARSSTGTAQVKDGYVEVLYADQRAERWSGSGDQMSVLHWHPATAMPHATPVAGTAVRVIDGPPAALEVHEWGTFTVLEGSDGRVIEWYQAPDKLVDLPPFVRRSLRVAGKAGTSQFGRGRMDTLRMETPVLYFYPQHPMDVTVSARFPMGRITEVFPPAKRFTPAETVWRGTLLPPDSPERSKVPAATGPAGRHYGAAREVPDAWLFRNLREERPESPALTTSASPLRLPLLASGMDLLRSVTLEVVNPATAPTATPDKKAVEPIDHFIFYRGAGNHGDFALSAVQGEGPDTFTLSNAMGATIPKLFALRVREGQTSWLALDQLDSIDFEEGKILNRQSFTFPAPAGPATEIAAELRAAMIASLHSEGLTPDEAAAMVATWDDLWFTEPGTRILAILPQSFADKMVPLTITPRPRKLDRVFVARVEIITRECEERLTSLLAPPVDGQPLDLDAAAAQLQALQLGRYTAGGMERATAIVSRQMRDRFARLTQAASE